MDAYGYSLQGTTHLGSRLAVMFGGELYDENIFSTRFIYDPVTRAVTQDRALYPNNSRYRTGGVFVQSAADLFRRHVRATFGLRYSGAGYKTFAADNFTDGGRSLGVVDSSAHLRRYDIQRRAGVAGGQCLRGVCQCIARVSCTECQRPGHGRARTLGYDVTGEDAIAANALVGLDSSDTALPGGKKVRQLGPETLANYELGFRFQTSRFYLRVHFFDSELKNPISGRTLLFPVNAVPSSIGGVPVTAIAPSAAQRAAGVVAVATSLRRAPCTGDQRRQEPLLRGRPDGTLSHYPALDAGGELQFYRRAGSESSAARAPVASSGGRIPVTLHARGTASLGGGGGAFDRAAEPPERG